MAKDPAFLFYSSDFLSGCIDLEMDERGQYITLLCAQHQKGHLSEKTIRLLVGSVSVNVLAKFSKDHDGNYFSPRLDEEIEKRKKFTESRKLNGQKGGRKPNAIPLAEPLAKPKNNHTENDNENENEDVIKIGVVGERFISIKKKYASDRLIKIYDIQAWFERTDQAASLVSSGYHDFLGFMKSRPAAMFDDPEHVYHAFLKFHKDKSLSYDRKGNKSSIVPEFSGDYSEPL